MQPDLPLSPEEWLSIVNDAVQTSGHADEVVVGLEVTMAGWRVGVLPPVQPATPEPPVIDG